jgi:hypothetical protein
MKDEIIKDLWEVAGLGSGIHAKKTIGLVKIGHYDKEIKQGEKMGAEITQMSDLLMELTK